MRDSPCRRRCHKDADSTIHSALLGYVRSLDLWGKSGQIAVWLPYSWLSASGTIAATGERRTREVSGLGDPALRVSVNLYGAPALSLEEFAHYQQDTIVGVTLVMTAPLGQYDPDKLANIGANRWSVKPEVGISKALGRWTLEAAAAVTFYTTNDEFLGGTTREQDPIYSVQGHVIYNFRSGIWAALNTTFYTGGRTTIDDVKGDDLQRNLRLGLTVALPVNRRNSIKLNWSTGVYTRTGSEFDLVGVTWVYQWGGGL
ncbi:MAG: transporter [Candidatus Methylomirabilis sp.]